MNAHNPTVIEVDVSNLPVPKAIALSRLPQRDEGGCSAPHGSPRLSNIAPPGGQVGGDYTFAAASCGVAVRHAPAVGDKAGTSLTAAAWRKNAAMTDAITVNTESDRQALRLWADHCRKMADACDEEIDELCK